VKPVSERHVIVCGLHGLSIRIIEQLLTSGCSVTVLDNSGEVRFTEMLSNTSVTYLSKSPHLEDSLVEAGIFHAHAVICTQVDELETLETALRVRELRPDIRLVIEFSNKAVGRALSEQASNGAVYDIASLAGPAFVEACLGSSRHHIALDGTNFEVIATSPPRVEGEKRTFRDLFGALAPVAIRSGTDLAICPGRDHLVDSEDKVWLLGESSELGHLQNQNDATSGTSPGLSRSKRIRRQLSVIGDEGNRALLWMLVALTVLIVSSALIMHFAFHLRSGKHLDLLSSLYFSVETIAGIAFGDYSFGHQSAWLKVFGIAEISLGLIFVTASFALFTNVLVARRIERTLGRREVTTMSDHVIVVGLGSFGLSIVEQLVAAKQHVVVIEKSADNRYLSRARALGVPIVIADATQAQTLHMVNAQEARSFAVATSDDLTNIETGLALRENLGERWGEVPVALRVFDRDLAKMMESAFGFESVLSTAAIAAPWFVSAALGLDVLSSFSVDQATFLVGRATVSRGGGLDGLAMGDLSSKIRVIALKHPGSQPRELEYPPRRGTRFSPGDEAFLLGPSTEILSVLQQDHAGAIE
jgi:Trk K+ transport system NAD-binding subunit